MRRSVRHFSITQPAFQKDYSQPRRTMSEKYIKSPFPDQEIPKTSFSDYVFSQIEGRGDTVALVESKGGRSLSFSELEQQSKRCASSLFRRGLRHKDVVGICASNCLEFSVVLLAANSCGAAVTCTNPNFKKGEILQQFGVSKPKMLFVSTAVLPLLKQVAKEVDCVEVSQHYCWRVWGPVENFQGEGDLLVTTSKHHATSKHHSVNIAVAEVINTCNQRRLSHIRRVCFLSNTLQYHFLKKHIVFTQAIFTIEPHEEFVSFDTLVQEGTLEDFPSDIQIDPLQDTSLLFFSSGTTGLPKSVMLTHHNIIALTVSLSHNLQISSDGCVSTERPIYHIGGILGILAAMHTGCKCVINEDCPLEVLLKALEVYRVTHLFLVPPAMMELCHSPFLHDYDISSLETIICGGASVSPALIATTEERLKAVVCKIYGLTEAAPITYGLGREKPTTFVGSLSLNITVKITDLQSGEDLGPNKHGEIVVKGPVVTKGYMKNPEATAKAFDSDGWFRTGDIGYYDDDGLLYVIDRLKEVIKYMTYQVAPAEIERALLSHPKVADAGVVGIPDDLAGEVPLAFVVKADESLTSEEVKGWVAENLAEYKQLRGGVRFTDAIPKNTMGKLLRKELLKIAKDTKI